MHARSPIPASADLGGLIGTPHLRVAKILPELPDSSMYESEFLRFYCA